MNCIEKVMLLPEYNFDVNTEKGEIEYVKGSDFETVFEREISAYKLRYRRV